MTEPPESQSIVFVVDDDASMRNSLCNLFRSVGLRVAVFGSGTEFLQSKLPDVASCLVLDIRLPGISGLDFQTELVQANIHIPVIFMTGHGDYPDDGQGHEGRSGGFPDQAFSRPGYA